MSTHNLCLTSHEGQGVWRLCLTRPQQHNALSDTLIEELTSALNALRQKSPEECRVLILSSLGTNFCAGADLAQMKEKKDASFEDNFTQAQVLSQLFYALASFPAPVICAVQGAAVGGGLGLVSCCDFAIATSQSTFATSEVLLGIVPGVISPYIIRKLSITAASSLMLTGKRISAETALSIGLINQIAPNLELDHCVENWVRDLCQAGPQASRTTKELILKASPLPNLDTQSWTAQRIANARISPEGQEGLSAFLEKRNPSWRT